MQNEPLAVRNPSDPRWKFLQWVFFSNSIRDSITTRTGRRVYLGSPTAEQASALWKEVTAYLMDIGPSYSASVSEEEHLKNIGALLAHVSSCCHAYINEGRITFGVAQKALNTYLKYLWCDGLISMPPHCPFDSIVLNQLSLPKDGEYRWTYGSHDHYLQWTVAAKIKAGNRPLSEWELDLFNDRTSN